MTVNMQIMPTITQRRPVKPCAPAGVSRVPGSPSWRVSVPSRVAKKILSRGRKNVDQRSVRERPHSMLDVRWREEAIAFREDLPFIADRDLEAAVGDVGDLPMRMMMHRADGALPELDGHHHERVVVIENLAPHTVANTRPRRCRATAPVR